MSDLPEVKRNYQAEVHFALGAVIQGITVAALGNELAAGLRALPFAGAVWFFVAGAQSLLLCTVFWYSFMNNYFFGFRVVNLSAKIHFFFAAFYLILGLQQLIAIQFLDMPRVWMTFYVLLLATALAGSWVTAHVSVINRREVRQTLAYDPLSKAFLACFILAVACLVAWYAIPGIDTVWFRVLAFTVSAIGLAVFAVYYVLVFQKHLDVE
jgi:hypothetical protein